MLGDRILTRDTNKQCRGKNRIVVHGAIWWSPIVTPPVHGIEGPNPP